MRVIRLLMLVAALLCAPLSARAEITIGISVSATGPGASLGQPISNTIAIVPKTIGREPVKYVVVNDESDPASGTKAIRKLAVEDNADVVIGSSSVPVAAAQAAAVADLKVSVLALGPIRVDALKQPWVFVIPQPVVMMVEVMVEQMKAAGIKSVGFIGFSDATGDQFFNALQQIAPRAGIKLVAAERYARTDSSVTAQVLKVLSAAPDAVYVGGVGTAGVLPQIALAERGFKGPVYHTHGVFNPDFIRVGGKDVEGALAPTGPLVVAEQLADSNVLKSVGLGFKKSYEAKYGAGSLNPFAGYAYDAYLVISAAVPQAMKNAKPGTAAFSEALRDAIEGVREVIGTHGVYAMSASDHNGVDNRARVVVRVDKGQWRLVK